MFDVAAESIELMGKKSHFDCSTTTSTAKPVTWGIDTGEKTDFGQRMAGLYSRYEH